MVAKVEYTTTQEQAWLVLAARAMSGPGGELAYSVDGAVQKAAKREPVVINPDAAAIARGVQAFTTKASGTVWMQVTARGVPQRTAAGRHPGAERAARVT